MGISMVSVAFEIFFWPEMIKSSAFVWLSTFMREGDIALLLLLLGWSRCAALMLNGQQLFGGRELLGIKVGPMVRAVCGVVSALLWSQFAVTLGWISYAQGYPSPGLPFWIMFTFAEIYAAYTTVKNGRSG